MEGCTVTAVAASTTIAIVIASTKLLCSTSTTVAAFTSSTTTNAGTIFTFGVNKSTTKDDRPATAPVAASVTVTTFSANSEIW